MNIPTFAIVDTNSDPTIVDFPIPANDDAAKSIDKILEVVTASIKEGLDDRNAEKAKNKASVEKAKAEKAETAEEETAEEATEEAPAKEAPAKKASKAKAEAK